MNLTGKSMIDQARIEWGIRLRFSPMPRLDMEWVVTQLNCFRIGDLWQCARTWEIMQERDPELQGSMNKRCEDVAALDWEIFCEDSDEGHAQKAALQYFFDHCHVTNAIDQDEVGDVSKLIFNIAKAHANRYSIHEIILRVDDAAQKQVTAEFRECPLWFFEARRGYLGYLQHLFDVYGQPLATGEWLPAVGYGYMRACSILYTMKWMSTRDWLLFSQRMAIPWLQALTDANPGSQEWNDAMEALQTLANDGAVLTNKALELKLLETGTKPDQPFEPLIERIDRAYDRMFRGSDLASGSRATKQGSGPVVGASVQGDEKDILLRRDAKWITPILQERVVRPFIAYMFGVEPKAWIKVLGPTDEDTENDQWAASFAVNNGIPYAISTWRETFGVDEPKPGEALIEGPQAQTVVPGQPGQPVKPQTPSNTPPNNKSTVPVAIARGADVNRNPQTIDPGMPGGSKPLTASTYAGGAERTLSNDQPNPGPSNAFLDAATEDIAKAVAPDLSVLNRKLAELLTIEDPELRRQRATQIQDWINRNEQHLAQPDHVVEAFHNLLSTAFANGLAATQPNP